MVYITAIHMEGDESHEHIASVRWLDPSSQETGESTRQGMVDWIQGGGDARVTDGSTEAKVGVVEASPPFLRTYADGRATDNLLPLPRY